MCYHKLTNIYGDDFMKKISKILSIILTLIMVISIIPMSAITSHAATSGKCGENLTWSFDGLTGTLTISGTGAMNNYSYHSHPWESIENSIKKVVINNGVTTIGKFAFYQCLWLTSVTVSDTVITMEDYAFYGCISLTSIIIPDSVTKIGKESFYGCESLESVTIGKGVTAIGDGAFSYFTSLTDITVDSNNQYYSSDEYGVLFNKDKTTLIQYPIGNTRTSYAIPDGVIIIGDGAFSYCFNLTDIVVPNSVTTIGNSAFLGCISLASMIIPNGVTTIDDFTFYECNSLASVTIPNGVTTIGDWAFPNCYSLTSVTIPNGVTTIGEGAFSGCDSLTSVRIPASVTRMGNEAFRNCNNLTDVYYLGTEENWYSISIGSKNNPIYNATIHYKEMPLGTCGDDLTWVFDELTGTLTISGTGAMNNYSSNNRPWENYEYSIKNVVISNGVTTIGNYALYDCYSLTSVTIPDSVTTIGNYAFSYCYGITSVIIGDSVTTIGDWAFYDCTNLTSVTIGDSVTTIGDYAFYDLDSLTSVTIPDSVTTIGDSAFSCCDSLTSVIIGDSVTTIGDHAFDGCYYLENVTLGDSVTTIGYFAFYGCSFASIIIPDSVTTIDGAFYLCGSLESITIPDGVTTIGSDTFGECYSLTSITIPSSVTAIGDYAFSSCLSLTSITIPDSVTTIGDSAFYNCGLESITIPNGVTTIGYEAFYSCDNLTDVYYYGTEKEWNSIFIDEYNDELLNATIHYNYIDPDKFTGFKGDYFYKNDVRQKAYQLVEFEGDYYFINDGHKISKNKRIYLSERFVEGTDLKVGYYDFDAEGKMILLNGPVGDYFYKDNVRLKAYQLVEFEGDYYFINDGHKIAKNKRIYLSERFVEGTDLKVGYYEFDAEGKMVYLNGPVGDYFYKDNVRLNAYQLVEFEGNYYFINDSHKLAKNKRIYLSERFVEGTDIKVGYYEFDAEGKMVYLNGPVGDYFYKDNVRLKAYQLVEFEGDYYFINDSHKLAKNKRIYLSQRFVEGTDLKVGYYNFDTDGKLIIE